MLPCKYFNFCFIYFETFFKFRVSKLFYVDFFHNFCYSKKVKWVDNRAVLKAYGPSLETLGGGA